MCEKQGEMNNLINYGREIEEYIGKEVLKEGNPIIILQGYEWLREVMSLLAKNMNLFGSCLTLLENNMEQEAFILARSQFNNTLWINYLCGDLNNKRTKEFFYELHITQLLQLKNIRKYIKKNNAVIRNSGVEIIEESEINATIKNIERLLKSEGYNLSKLGNKSISQLAKEKPELFGMYISMYCEGSKYEHSSKGITDKYRKKIFDEYSTNMVFKLDMGSSDFDLWKNAFYFSMSNIFQALDALHERINNRDSHLFENGMLSEQAIAKSMIMIKRIIDQLNCLNL